MLLFCIFLALPLFAQVKTGGGIIDPTTIVIDDDSGSKDNPIKDFMHHLTLRHFMCRDKGYASIKLEHDIQRTYIQLMFIKQSHELKGQCEKLNPYLSCLADSRYKKLLKEVKSSKEVKKEMKKKYKMTPQEVKNMLEFFETLDNECENKCE